MTVPFAGVPLHEHREWYRELVDLGYTDIWSAETDGPDGFTPLALAAAWAPELRLGTAIIPSFTRGPACLAQSVAALADAAPGRFVLGIGSSSNVIVERWNDIAFDRPYQRTRDMVRFVRSALTGEKVKESYETFSVSGFKLSQPPAQSPPILIAALRPGMLRLAGREGDGAIINWLAPHDVSTVVPIVVEAAAAAGRPTPEIAARIFVAPIDDAEAVRGFGRFALGCVHERARLRRVPPLAGTPGAVRSHVGRLVGRRPAGGPGGHSRRCGRRAHRARLPRSVPGADR